MIWNEILCLGDSITYGARDSQGRSFPAELGKILHEKTGEFYYCHNKGICGETSSDLLRRAWSDASAAKNSKIATLLIGTNDTQIPISEDIYEDNLRQIISILKVHGMNIVLCTLPELAFTPLYIKNKEYISKYNKIIFKLSEQYSTSLCKLDNTEKYYIDGVHYTHKGYKVIASKISNLILKY